MNTTPQGRILYGYISHYEVSTGQYYVKYQGMPIGANTKGYRARLLSSTPFTDGGGMQSVPKSPIDTPCLLFNIGTEYAIIGFLSPKGVVTRNSPYPSIKTELGDTVTTHNTGSLFGFRAVGSWVAWVNEWANIVLHPIRKQLSAFFKNMMLTFYAGYISYAYDDEKAASLLTVQISKSLETAAIKPGTLQKDRVTFKVGQIKEDEHLAEMNVKQAFDSTKKPAYNLITKFGKQKDGTWLDIFSTSGATNPSTYALKADDKGKLQFENKVGAKTETSVALTIDPSQTNVVELKVNGDKATISIDKEGNVTIKTAEAAKIKLGGTGKEQALVTEAWVTQVFKNHIHPTTGPGAPTLPPNPDLTLPASKDNKMGHFTFTTQAE